MTDRLRAAVAAILEGHFADCERAVRTGVTWPEDRSVKGRPWRQLINTPALRELFAAAEEAGIWSEPRGGES